jgi:sugar (pentulose or hexulose) kinase
VPAVAAVDLGASSGRVIVGSVGPGELALREVGRFANVPVRVSGRLHWDILRLYRGVLEGLRAAGPVESVGIDSWAIDYGLLDSDGRLIGNPVCYRDSRTDGIVDRLVSLVPELDAYRATGIPYLPINTASQLVSALGTAELDAAATVLLIPDLLAYWLTGVAGAELTNASTTQLVSVGGGWDAGLIGRLGLRASWFPPLRAPGEAIGPVRSEVDGLAGVPVVAVGSHDTASAVVGVPAAGERFAYVSCGTWSLVGVELPAPVLTVEALAARFTNEVGVDGTVRFLRNVMGLWLLQECLREWGSPALGPLLAAAAGEPALASVFEAGDPGFLAPGGMPGRIAASCARLGSRVPRTPAAYVRSIVDSLALGHRLAVEDAQRLAGVAVDVVHVVGGGSRNELLCQLTADACGLPVVAGPVEAAAVGNVLVQARALGAVGPDLAALRGLLRATAGLRRYEPRRADRGGWDAAAARLSSAVSAREA